MDLKIGPWGTPQQKQILGDAGKLKVVRCFVKPRVFELARAAQKSEAFQIKYQFELREVILNMLIVTNVFQRECKRKFSG